VKKTYIFQLLLFLYMYLENHQLNISTEFGSSWPSGFREED